MNSEHRPSPHAVYTVSELNRRIKTILESAFPIVWVTGEISNLRIPVSGHVYFTLKDRQNQINAVIFKGQARHLAFEPEDGLAILGMGRLTVYEPRGTYQIIIEFMEPRGVGHLQLAFEQLKRQLADEGLFDDKHKQQPPALPTKIHVITSPTGAVVFDIQRIVARRFANMPMVVIPTAVQGPYAVKEIVAAIELLNQQPDAQIAILARGGGSLEDLQAFNDEAVARAIYDSKVPLVSAIGHETDFTISDFVADLRAPTPSAAAEMIVPQKNALSESIITLSRKLDLATRSIINRKRRNLENFRDRLQDPRRRIYDGRLHLDDLTQRLSTSLHRLIRERRRELSLIASRLVQNPWHDRVKTHKRELEQIDYSLLYLFNNNIKSKKWMLQDAASRLNALSPLAVLKRGYSITRSWPQKTIIRQAGQVKLQQPLKITLASGSLRCRVEGKERDGEENL